MKQSVNKQRIREYLRTLHTEADLRAWFDPLRLKLTESGTLEVRFPHSLFSTWFGKERQKYFERELSQCFEHTPKIIFIKPGNAAGSKIPPSFSGKNGLSGSDRQFSFDSFIYNQKNDFPVTMAREIAFSAKNPPYVPFVICGKGSCGKTHLLRAMADAMAASFPAGGIYLGTVEEADALFQENPAAFKRKMLRHKAVFLDNGQNLTAFPDLQQELVHIAETFKEKKKPFVLAIDESLDLTALNPKLRTRLESGLAVTVKKADLDVRIRYTKSQCVASRLHLKKDIILSLAQRCHSLTAIQGIIAKASAFQQKKGDSLTLSDFEKLMAGTDILSGKPPTPQAVVSQVAEAFSLAPEDMFGHDRRAEAVLARQTAMYLCRVILGTPYSSLGQYFNGRNHATVIYACKKIEKITKSDKVMNKLVTQIRKKFLSAS